ncbi:cytochrome P450 [Nocardia iowensis]|uniref:Cytochrome P450 n=1 Tax=Nocardia iowensis TaxID=204891 RepID=A0ABX8RN57_NOCIO|nr:cytochrome P450 [Nocardia iowensis]QXN90741.1 cytochrome P450 [Nocardia iowensis]
MELDLTDPEFFRDPYPVYRGMREHGPLFRSANGPWVAIGFREVSTLLKSDRVSADFSAESHWQARRGDAGALGGRWLLFNEGDSHRTLRRIMSRRFMPGAIAERRGKVANLIDSTLRSLPSDTVIDFIGDVAEPVVTTLVRDTLGLPADQDHNLTRWSAAIIRMSDPLTSTSVRGELRRAVGEFRAFVDEAWRAGQLHPDGLAADLLSADSGLDHPDGVANIVMLLMAGLDTTVGQLGCALMALTPHPDQFTVLRDDPDPAKVGELLRYDSPVHIVTRRILTDIDCPAGTLRAGQKLMLLLAAANRDPNRYPDPDRLWLNRPGVEQLAFGAGTHYCLGSHLARLTVFTLLARMARRYTRVRLVDTDLSWRPSVVARRLDRLPVRLETR